VQRDRITAWASLHGIEILRWWEEEDQSGGKMSRPKLAQLLRRIQAKETEGVIVAERSRFGRTLMGALTAIEQITDAGGVFVSADGFNSGSKEDRLFLTQLLAFAEFELERIRQSWHGAVKRAVEDGAYVAPVPVGYAKNGKRQGLVPDPVMAPKVRDAFKMRAEGVPWQQIADMLGMSKSGAFAVIQNRAYLGESRGQGSVLKIGAHDALVTEDLWLAAQPGSVLYDRNGAVSAQGMLRGLVRCAACGYMMSLTGPAKHVTYSCKGHHKNGKCPSPASASVHKLDQFVNDELGKRFATGDPSAWSALDEDARRRDAREALEDAQRQLEAYVETADIVTLGKELFERGLTSRREAVERTRRRLREIPPAPLHEPPALESDWTIEDNRAEMSRFVARVVVAKADPARRRWQPMGERVEIRWRVA
jgi:DNA invertase Pin-like site-specific DNA recombinase